MRAYSEDLRERVVKAVNEEGQSTTQVAERSGISRWTVRRYVDRDAKGKLAPVTPPGRPSRIYEAGLDVLRKQVDEHPDWTLTQHAQGLEEIVSLKKSSIGRYLKLLGISFKKNALPPGT